MSLLRSFQRAVDPKRFLYDKSLTRKAYLNALSSAIDYGSQLLVAFLITPLMVSALGDFYYGVWQILNRLVGYLSPAAGKSTQALRWTLASEQSSNDDLQKRRQVGSAVSVWIVFFPVLGLGGVILTWYIPFWLKAPLTAFTQIRATTLLLVMNVVMSNLVSLPQYILQGQNLGYKRIGLTAMLALLSGVFTWIALNLNSGIVGVATAALAITILSGFLYFRIARANIPWLGIERPTRQESHVFLKLSMWFLIWSLIMKLMVASDVVVLGLLKSVESVASYSLTKFAPDTAISLIAIMVFAAVPGLGGIIGAGDFMKAARIRTEIMSISWLLISAIGITLLVWNRVFITLWVGGTRYAGEVENLLMVLVVIQFVFIRNDANIIDLTLRLQQKVLMGALSVIVTIAVSAILVAYVELGVSGLCLGLIIGRSVLSLSYPILIGRILRTPFSAQIKGVVRPAAVTAILFGLAYLLTDIRDDMEFTGLLGWLLLMGGAAVTAGFVLLVSFRAGLHAQQRRYILLRLTHIVSKFSA